MVDKTKPQYNVVCDKCGYAFKSRIERMWLTCPNCQTNLRNSHYVGFSKPVVK